MLQAQPALQTARIFAAVARPLGDRGRALRARLARRAPPRTLAAGGRPCLDGPRARSSCARSPRSARSPPRPAAGGLADARLDAEPRPRRALLRAADRPLREGRARRHDPRALRSHRAAEARRRRRHRPRGLLRAGAVLRRREQAAGHRGRRDRPPAARLDHGDRPRDPLGRRPQGQVDRHHGRPLRLRRPRHGARARSA